MATITITKQWANGEVLLEADLDYIKTDIETFLNTTKLTDDNLQNAGITASSKLIDGTITAAKLGTSAVETAKINDLAVTTAKIAAANVTAAKLATDVTTSLTPTGVVWPYAGTSAPTGFLLCDGSAISRTTYANLFAVLSTTYNTGGEAGTDFRIPDLRGRVIAGQDDMGGTSANRLTAAVAESLDGDTLGATGGAETHALTNAQLATHTHAVSGTSDVATGGNRWSLVNSFAPTGDAGGAQSDMQHQHAISFTSGNNTNVSTGAVHNNVQPTIILNYIIKT